MTSEEIDPETEATCDPVGSKEGRPVVDIGLIFLDDGGERAFDRVTRGGQTLREHLAGQFPEFSWQCEVVVRQMRTRQWRIDPLDLLELGVQEKVEHGWDMALVVTECELEARDRAFVYGVPSSALETGVISLSRTTEGKGQLPTIAQFLIGSMLGLEPMAEGPMHPPDSSPEAPLAKFSERERSVLLNRLSDVSDARLEEKGGRWSKTGFRWQTFRADPKGILRDLIGQRPWMQPFRLGKLTGAAFVATLLSFLGAEVWELGIGSDGVLLFVGVVLAVASSSFFLFRGQNFAEVTRHQTYTEQMARTELVLATAILTGMCTLWIMLAASSFVIASALPAHVVEGWIATELDVEARMRFAAFVSMIGTLAGALGGNLEEEDDFKARFFFDEEI